MTFCKEMSSRVEEPFCKNIYIYMLFRHWYKLLFRLVHNVFESTQSSGVLAGNGTKEAKIQKYKRWQRKGILTKRLLENQRDREKRSREPEVAALQNDTKKRYLKSQLSQLVIKRSSSGIQHEKSCHLTKWWRILESNVGAKNLCFL